MIVSFTIVPFTIVPFMIVPFMIAYTSGQRGRRALQGRRRAVRDLEKGSNVFHVGIFLDFVRLTTRAPHVGPQHVRGAKRNRHDRRSQIVLPRLPGLHQLAQSFRWPGFQKT